MKTVFDGNFDGSFAYYIADEFISGDFNVNKRIALVVDGINAENAERVRARLADLYGDVCCKAEKDGKEIPSVKFDDGFISLCPVRITVQSGNLIEHKRFDFYDLTEIMKRLRAGDGCEWDKAQTHQSIRINLIEEAYELVEAIDLVNRDMMLEESGDVLMQSVFHTEIAEEEGDFDFSDMLTALCRKLIDRHTHIFGSNHANDADEALVFWNEAKKKEKKYASTADAMNRVPKNLPALLYAEKLIKLAKKAGFRNLSADEATELVKEKLAAYNAAYNSTTGDLATVGGELIFAVVELLRQAKVDPETALHDECGKFYNKFERFETATEIAENGKND